MRRRYWSVIVGGMMVLGSAAAGAVTYTLAPGADVVGTVKRVQAREQDTLSDIARRFGVGYEEIRRANPGVDPWLPREGTWVTVPAQYVLPDTPREGLVLNLPEMRLYYYPPPVRGKAPVVMTFPVSIGRMDWSTPLGLTRVSEKVRSPTWRPPPSVRAEHAQEGDALPAAVPAGPDNPLGDYALRLALPGYLIHGTNRPYGIGMQVTHGCVRLYPEDIELLFQEVPSGTPVRIVDQPFKSGWRDGQLYLQAHPLPGGERSRNLTPAMRALIRATAQRAAPIDWDRAWHVAEEARGVPARVLR